jgi:hypothetical protein
MRPASLGPDTLRDQGPWVRLVQRVHRPPAVSEPGPPSARFWAFAALMALVVAAVVGTGVFAWQRGEVSDRQATVARVGAERDRALAAAEAADGRISTLEVERARLRERVTTLSTGRREMALLVGSLRGQLRETGAVLDDTRGLLEASTSELAGVRRELRVTRSELRSLTGPTLADGTRYGRIEAVGWDQAPPRLVVDRTALTPEGMENRTTRWLTVEVAPGASVRLARPNGTAVEMDLATFGTTFGRQTAFAASLRASAYGLRVIDGTIAAIWQRGSR